MTPGQKFAHALDGLIRSRTKGHGGDEFARKCMTEMAEAMDAAWIGSFEPSASVGSDHADVRHLLLGAVVESVIHHVDIAGGREFLELRLVRPPTNTEATVRIGTWRSDAGKLDLVLVKEEART